MQEFYWSQGISTLLHCYIYKIEYFFLRWGIQGASLHSFIFHTQHLQEDTFLFALHIIQQNGKKGEEENKTNMDKKTEQRTATILAPLSKPSHVRPSGRLTSLCIHRENNYTSSRLYSLM